VAITGIPIFGFHAHGQAVFGDGGVVDQDVEAAEFFDDLFESGLYLVLVGDVQFLTAMASPPACVISFTSEDNFSSLRAACGHLCTGFGQGQGGVAAYALRGSGYQGYFVF